ncbi:MAG: hypothetical protein IJ046_02475 [Clostridia bacterium]|nr:hypothetical protein [Clostridia bacterium]
MKIKGIIIFALLAAVMLSVCGCRADAGEDGAREGKQEEEERYFYICVSGGALERQVAEYIEASLRAEGYTAVLGEGAVNDGGIVALIAVGRDAVTLARESASVPVVLCDPSGSLWGEDILAPGMSSGGLARAARLLLPAAESFAVITETEGGQDVQDACDHLDLCGVDYTVETLDGRTYGDAVISAAKKGCDVLLLPFGDVYAGGGIDLSGYGTAVISVGEGEPVRGCLATFCVDTEGLARFAAARAVDIAEGRECEEHMKSFYTLCISESLSKRFFVDIEAVREDFSVVLVE